MYMKIFKCLHPYQATSRRNIYLTYVCTNRCGNKLKIRYVYYIPMLLSILFRHLFYCNSLHIKFYGPLLSSHFMSRLRSWQVTLLIIIIIVYYVRHIKITKPVSILLLSSCNTNKGLMFTAINIIFYSRIKSISLVTLSFSSILNSFRNMCIPYT